MTPQQLRNSILQMAIEGKLTEQRAEDGNAADLLKEIKAEKARLIAEKKIKKEKPLPEISEDEIPFEIPDNWVWVRFGDALDIRDGTHDTPKYLPSGIPLVTSKNINNGIINFDDVKYISKEDADKINNRSLVEDDDILFAMIGSIGNPVIVKKTREFCIKNIALFKQYFKNKLCMNYVYYFLLQKQSEFKQNASGGVQSFVSLKLFRNYLFQLPPLAEQKRIVARLEEILPQVEEYEKAYNELQELNKKFPANLKNSLLQMAIEGKLVEQRAEEGNAADLLKEIKAEKARLIKEKKIKKEKPLPEISEDEIPFEIPDNWIWCKLGTIGYLERGSGIKRADVVEKGLPCIRYGELYTTYKGSFSKVMSFTSQEIFDKSHKGHCNDIFMALTGENKIDIATAVEYVGKMEIAYGGDMTKLCCIKAYSRYIMYLLNSPYVIDIKKKTATGDIIVHISNDKIANFVIPLPPLAEQKRIVAKLEQLLPLCDELSKEYK